MSGGSYSAAAYGGGYYTYDERGAWTGYAVSPKVSFRYAPRDVADLIRVDARLRRAADKKERR